MPEEKINGEISFKEERIRNITQIYYSRPEVQKAIFEFSKNREICPRFFEGFGKRPDSFQYPGDIFDLVKRGATSFHCSEELWKDPLRIFTGMTNDEANEMREGWDLLIDIDSKYLDYSKVMGELIVKALKFSGVKNIGVKFSGSKGFHLIVPWKAFPKEVYGNKTSNMFPEYPRIIAKYLAHLINDELVKKISVLAGNKSTYVKDTESAKEVIPDLVLVSPRHLFRMPYSLHEKTALASIVIDAEKIKDFEPHDAEPMKIKIRNFIPESKEGEASELLVQALDWDRETNSKKEAKKDYNKKIEDKKNYAELKITELSENLIPPSIKKILSGGMSDGKKRALFILINFFRSINLDKKEVERRIDEWNKKNNPSLKEGYIQMQIDWTYSKKAVLPPNYDKDYYKGIGIIPTEEELRLKNPISYVSRKNFQKNINDEEEKKKLKRASKAKKKEE